MSKIKKERQRSKTLFGKYVSKNFTLVTAYWDLGTFHKGGTGLKFSTDLYKNWAKAFKYMLNPLVIYTDSLDFKHLMQAIRNDLSFCTRIIYMNRTKVPAFQRVDRIKEIYDQPGYPKYFPNTVNPSYAAAQNAKLNVVADTYRNALFNTTFYGWIDVGYFRDIVDSTKYYTMVVPPDIDVKRVAYNQLRSFEETTDPIRIFRDNQLWVGGGMFIGLGTVIDAFDKFYQKAVDYFLDLKVMNSDQQVLYSIYTTRGRQALNPTIEVQPYKPKSAGNPWFYLGFLCRKVVKIF